MDEQWLPIEGFPMYQVSDSGRVINKETGRYIRPSITRSKVVKIGLTGGDRQYTRSVKLLVANAFVPGYTDIFDTPIHLDGDPLNNFASNLIWRPRWFAWKYTHQFAEPQPGAHRGPVKDVDTGLLYRDIQEAAIRNGLLIQEVARSINVHVATFPTWQTFAFVD